MERAPKISKCVRSSGNSYTTQKNLLVWGMTTGFVAKENAPFREKVIGRITAGTLATIIHFLSAIALFAPLHRPISLTDNLFDEVHAETQKNILRRP